MGKNIVGITLLLLLCCGFTACNKKPNAFDRTFYDIKTNVVPYVIATTNYVTTTNWVPVPVVKEITILMVSNGVPSTITNWIPWTNWNAEVSTIGQVTKQTNFIENFDFTPKAGVTDSAQAAGGVLNMFMPGTGGLLTTALVGIAGIYARLRSRKANEALVQGVETGKQLVAQTLNDPAVDQKYKDFLMQQQKALGVFNLVSGLVDKFRDKKVAQVDAAQILAQAAAAQPVPARPVVPPPYPVSPVA